MGWHARYSWPANHSDFPMSPEDRVPAPSPNRVMPQKRGQGGIPPIPPESIVVDLTALRLRVAASRLACLTEIAGSAN